MCNARFADSMGTETTLDRDSPKQRTPEEIWDQGQKPFWKEHAIRQSDRQQVTSYRDPPVDRRTDTYRDITSPQTSFAGGKKYAICWYIYG